MLWTAEAVEELKRLALEGKSASHIAAALGVGSRNAVIGKASRIGIKLSGGGRASVRGKGDPRAARPQWAAARLHSAPCRRAKAPALPPLMIPRSQPGDGQDGVDAWRSRDRRDAAAAVRGHSRIRLPVAAGRSEKRRFRLLRAHASRGPVLLRRPLPDGLSAAAAASRARASEPGFQRHRRVRGGCREMARRLYAPSSTRPPCLEHADQARSVRARFAPGRRGLDEERPQAGLARGRLDIGAAVGKPHRRLELESVALASFDREREQAVRGQRRPDGGEQRREVADINERVRGDDEIEGSRAARASSIATASPTLSSS